MYNNPYATPFANPYLTNFGNFPNQYGATQPQQSQQNVQANTNKIYVNGIEDVRNRVLPPNSDYIFLDNDKPILYQKVVSASGQFEVKPFTIVPYVEEHTVQPSVDFSLFVTKEDFASLQKEVALIRDNMSSQKGGTGNGSSKPS